MRFKFQRDDHGVIIPPTFDGWPWCVPLTQGFVTAVSVRHFDLLMSQRWHVQINRDGTVYAARKVVVTTAIGPRSEKQYLHRYITGAKPGVYVDHKFGNTLDNRDPMLRIVPGSANAANRELEPGACGFRGITRKGRRFQARIGVEGARICLGCFDSPEEAARAYDAKAREIYGEFALVNFDNRQPEVISDEAPF
jgi:hypothetical protein